MNNNPLFNWQDIAGILPKLLENLPVTLGITLASLLLGLTIALLIVLLQFSRFKPLSAVANGYTDILRGAPLALLILLLFFGGMIAFIGGLALLFGMMSQQSVSLYSTLFANILLFSIICGFIISGIRKKINVYDTFIEGAKEGFQTAVTIIPYLIAVLVAIAVFRASGAMDFLIDGIRMGVSAAGLDTQFVEGLPTMLMKPLSGSGARGMMLDAMNTYGADSFIGRLCSIVQGSSDTTFYVVALYFGSVGIRNTYYTIPCSLLADLAGAVAAVTMTYLFFT